ncbi:MAG TPA: MmgE/PrpD family protein [Casimicrobiaceae bacterium]|nr:MmgE/PrpD family protein [Casimicrobiaceae bacterium]
MSAEPASTRAASVAQTLAQGVQAIAATGVPANVRTRLEELLIDVVGLCIAARNTDYIRAVMAGVDAGGPCTAVGHAAMFRAEDAAMINGTAAHGEDFDDTFEGGPVHSGAVIVPAVLAACERFKRSGQDALLGIAVGTETLCRLSFVRPKAIHKAGFHPTSVLGAIASTLAVCATLRLDVQNTASALGIAGSMASGIIEYLAEGAWTKRLHAGWAARIGLHATRLAQAGFLGPRTVLEGTHGLFHGFAHASEGDYEALLREFGRNWVLLGLTFKPYATGTMNQPYVDCALRLHRRGIAPEEIEDIVCETAEGYVHRLWEPLAAKQRPANDYAAKFSTPFNIAVAWVTGDAGLSAFTPGTVSDPRILALAAKVRYVVDPDNPYPQRYTGHLRVTLRDGRVVEERQPHIRGGVEEPLARADIERKFVGNAAHGGWSRERADAFLERVPAFFDRPIDLTDLA